MKLCLRSRIFFKGKEKFNSTELKSDYEIMKKIITLVALITSIIWSQGVFAQTKVKKVTKRAPASSVSYKQAAPSRPAVYRSSQVNKKKKSPASVHASKYAPKNNKYTKNSKSKKIEGRNRAHEYAQRYKTPPKARPANRPSAHQVKKSKPVSSYKPSKRTVAHNLATTKNTKRMPSNVHAKKTMAPKSKKSASQSKAPSKKKKHNY